MAATGARRAGVGGSSADAVIACPGLSLIRCAGPSPWRTASAQGVACPLASRSPGTRSTRQSAADGGRLLPAVPVGRELAPREVEDQVATGQFAAAAPGRLDEAETTVGTVPHEGDPADGHPGSPEHLRLRVRTPLTQVGQRKHQDRPVRCPRDGHGTAARVDRQHRQGRPPHVEIPEGNPDRDRAESPRPQVDQLEPRLPRPCNALCRRRNPQSHGHGVVRFGPRALGDEGQGHRNLQ